MHLVVLEPIFKEGGEGVGGIILIPFLINKDSQFHFYLMKFCMILQNYFLSWKWDLKHLFWFLLPPLEKFFSIWQSLAPFIPLSLLKKPHHCSCLIFEGIWRISTKCGVLQIYLCKLDVGNYKRTCTWNTI